MGGIPRAAARIVKFLAESFEIHVFTFIKAEPGDMSVSSTSEDGVAVHRVRISQDASETIMALSIRQAIQSVDSATPFDLFHCIFLPLAYCCLDIAEKGGRPVIASLRGSDGTVWLEDEWHLNIVSKVLRRVAWVTSVNTDMLERLSAHGLVRERSSVIRNSIDSSSFPRWHATPDNRGVVGTVGEFRALKNIPLLVKAYAQISDELRRRLILVGDFAPSDEDEKARTAEVIRQLNLTAEAQLTGMVGDSEILERLLSLRVFVQCSKHEGFPNALIEAAAMGVPLVATAVGGMKEVLTNGENALLVPPDDQHSLASAIESVLRDESLALGLSEGARRLARSLDPEHEQKAWHELYRQLLPG
jgi:glycosyltransferase involved in cell wall biosynthesis